MMQISAIAFTGYPVVDIPRARAFYETLLGLKPSMVLDHGGKSWIEYDLAGHTLAISDMGGEMWVPSKDGPCLVFEVVDIAAAVAALKSAGVTFVLELMESPMCSMAIVLDPDGNSVGVHQRKAV